ncbi:hypothetical protein HMPREF9075_00985 [Capnocytophaga sp. oral taxon 332 str. F0381]|nr:hypothetical protein HMPREF9075_00985 [Capnocytophaga sp. oral taxon 332 str. F0381]
MLHSDNQSFLKCVVYGRFANAPLKTSLFIRNLFSFNYKSRSITLKTL